MLIRKDENKHEIRCITRTVGLTSQTKHVKFIRRNGAEVTSSVCNGELGVRIPMPRLFFTRADSIGGLKGVVGGSWGLQVVVDSFHESGDVWAPP